MHLASLSSLTLSSLVFFSLLGCTTGPPLERAATLAPGTSKLALGVTGGFADKGDLALLPVPVIKYRRGLSRHIDGSATLSLVGGGLGARYQLLEELTWTASIGVEAAAVFVPSSALFPDGDDETLLSFRVPLYVEAELSKHVSVMAVPSVQRHELRGPEGMSRFQLAALDVTTPIHWGRWTVFPTLGAAWLVESGRYSESTLYWSGGFGVSL